MRHKKPVKIIKTEKLAEPKSVPEAKLGNRQQPPAKNDTGKYWLNTQLLRQP